jgi:hypothetical protein
MMLNQNAVAYLAPSDDPWMPAHIQDKQLTSSVWVGDYDANLLGCTDQYQICNPNKANSCTSLTGQYSAMVEAGAIGLNTFQIPTVGRFLETAFYRTMSQIVHGRGATALNGKLMYSKAPV